jgi:hypothetical protein
MRPNLARQFSLRNLFGLFLFSDPLLQRFLEGRISKCSTLRLIALCWLKLNLVELNYSGAMAHSITLTLGMNFGHLALELRENN